MNDLITSTTTLDTKTIPQSNHDFKMTTSSSSMKITEISSNTNSDTNTGPSSMNDLISSTTTLDTNTIPQSKHDQPTTSSSSMKMTEIFNTTTSVPSSKTLYISTIEQASTPQQAESSTTTNTNTSSSQFTSLRLLDGTQTTPLYNYTLTLTASNDTTPISVKEPPNLEFSHIFPTTTFLFFEKNESAVQVINTSDLSFPQHDNVNTSAIETTMDHDATVLSGTQITSKISEANDSVQVSPSLEDITTTVNEWRDNQTALSMQNYTETTSSYFYETGNTNWTESVCWLESCPGGVGPSCTCIPGFYPSSPSYFYYMNTSSSEAPRIKTSSSDHYCLPCPIGTYKSVYGFDQCNQCPYGMMAGQPGSSTCSLCTENGFFAALDGTACVPCPAGPIPFSEKTFQCLVEACKPGYVSSIDKRVCVPCPQNWFQSERACIPCPPNHYTADEGSVQCLRSSDAGEDNHTTTIPEDGGGTCSTGSVLSPFWQICIPCPVNWIQRDNACIPCDASQYTEGEGAIECLTLKCAGGFVLQAKTCIPCAQHFFQSDDTCVPCPVGQYTEVAAATACQSCPSGSVLSADRQYCVPCALNWIQKENSCVPCPPYQYTDSEGATNCTPACPPGSVYQEVCKPCPQNWIQVGESCVACPSPQYTESEGSTSCIMPNICPPGTVASSFDRQLCIPCPQNWTQVEESCIPCPSPQYTESEGSTSCIVPNICPPGSVASSFDRRLCIPCPQNWTQVEESCVPCPPSQYTETEGSTLCIEPTSFSCPAGFLPSADGLICIPCPYGWYQTGGTCIQCAAGTHGPSEGSTTCWDCERGTYSNASAQTHCVECTVGTYAPTMRSTECFVCNNLSMPPFAGMNCSSPLQCPQHQYYSTKIQAHLNRYEGCIECTVCGAKTFTTQPCTETLDSVCGPCTEECPHRTVMTKYCTLYNDSVCSPICLPGEDQNCKPCAMGTMLDDLTKTCVPCPNGFYTGYIGATSCQTCSDGFPNGAKNACVHACESGAHLTLDDTNLKVYCELCKPGTYLPMGENECLPCPANTFAREWGQVSCDACSGSMSLSGSTVCSLQTCITML